MVWHGTVRVAPGSGTPLHLVFACCDGDARDVASVFADPAVVGDLRALRAGVAVAVPDFSDSRAADVRQLDAAGIPVEAWLALPADRGSYFSVDRAGEAAAHYAAFQQWTMANHLHWSAVGLDIEPNVHDFDSAEGQTLGLPRLLARRYFDQARVDRARAAYTVLIARMHADGYRVDTYQMPLIAAERDAHSTVLQRELGIVDVRGDEEALMLYTSLARGVGPGMIWELGARADAIAVGTTPADPTTPPLTWDEFSRDLRLAHHFTQTIGVYNLEGCIARGLLSRLPTMDWNEPVTIPRRSVVIAIALGSSLRATLWVLEHARLIGTAGVLLMAWLVWPWRRHRARRRGAAAAA